jgi:hypothetical protein
MQNHYLLLYIWIGCFLPWKIKTSDIYPSSLHSAGTATIQNFDLLLKTVVLLTWYHDHAETLWLKVQFMIQELRQNLPYIFLMSLLEFRYSYAKFIMVMLHNVYSCTILMHSKQYINVIGTLFFLPSFFSEIVRFKEENKLDTRIPSNLQMPWRPAY